MPSFDTTPDPGAANTFETIDAGGRDWYLGATNDQAAQLAWGESYVMMAYLTMYEATGETRYLDKFARHGAAAVNRTDRARGVTDYLGRSTGAWRCGNHYTIARLNLFDRAGHAVLKVIARSSSMNNFTQIRVLPGPTRTTFTLLVRNPYVRSERFRTLSLNPRSRNYVSRRVDRVSRLVRTRRLAYGIAHPSSVPAPAPYRNAIPMYYHYACQTGMVAYPLAHFYNIVEGSSTLRASYEATATRFLRAAKAAVAAHDYEWVGRRTVGYWKFRRGAPVWSDGIELPHNKMCSLGRAVVEIYAATGSARYRDRAVKLARLVKSHMRRDTNNAYIWNYWWGRGDTGWSGGVSVYTPRVRLVPRLEDLVHAGIDVDFAALAARNRIIFTPGDLIHYANTFHANMTRPDGTLTRFVTGTGVMITPLETRVGVGEWLSIAPLSRDVYRTTSGVLERVLMNRRRATGAILYAVARAVKAKRTLSADRRPLVAPAIRRLSGPIPRSRVRGSFTLAVRATGPRAPIVVFFADARQVGVDGRAPYRQRYHTGGLRDGWHIFRAVAWNRSGRTSALRLHLKVDNH